MVGNGGALGCRVNLLLRRAQLSPNRIAFEDGKEQVSFAQFNARVNQTAHFLRASHRIEKGDRVAVLAKNSMTYLELLFACGKLGAVLQTLNWRLTEPELRAILTTAPPKLLAFDAAHQTVASSLLHTGVSALPLASLHARSTCSTCEPDIPLQPDDVWIVCYTGGSTGTPKGAMLTHRSVFANAVNTVTSWGLTEGDVAILNAPLFHVGGLNVLTTPLLLAGGRSIVCESFDPGQVYALMAERGVTAFFGVPTMFLALAEHPAFQHADFSHIKIAISGGAPCPLPLQERFWERGLLLRTGYGLTEAGPNTFWLPSEEVRAKPGFVGYPLMTIETRIGTTERAAAPGEIGELLVRGDHVFAGYDRNAQATEEALRGGWLHTGDLAELDSDGACRIVGRKKEMYISGGENVYPAEIEAALAAHVDILECAVVSTPDPKWGEVGCAFVVARDGCTVTSEMLVTFLRGKLAAYKVPKRVVLLASLPKTGAGKIDKVSLTAKAHHA